MRGGRGLWLAVALVVAAGTGCKKKPVPLEPGLVRQAAGDVSADAGKAGVPATTAAAPVELPCAVGRVRVRELAEPPRFPRARVDALLRDQLAAGFVEPADGRAPFVLKLEYVVRPGESDADRVFVGAKGFLESRGREPAVVLEGGHTADLARPAACADDPDSDSCTDALLDAAVRPALTATVHQLATLCRLETASDEALGRFLASPEAWERAQAARMVGERGATQHIEALIGLALEKEPSVAIPAIAALGRLHAERALPVLVKRAGGAEEPVIRAVAVALADMDTPAAKRYLREWSKNHPLASIRDLATALLE